MVKMELIDKKETIRLLAKSRDSEPVHGDVSFGIKAGVDKAMIVISNFADVVEERKHGHWIETNEYCTGAYESLGYYKCSVCGAVILEDVDFGVGNYCQQCGAKMDEVAEDEVRQNK